MTDALWTADMITGPHGEAVDYPDRLAEILNRYEPDSIVGRAMSQARPLIEAAIDRRCAHPHDSTDQAPHPERGGTPPRRHTRWGGNRGGR